MFRALALSHQRSATVSLETYVFIQTKEVGLLRNSCFVMSRNTERSLRDTTKNDQE